MTEPDQTIGIFTTDRELVVRTWDAWLARVTGMPAATAQMQPLLALAPEIEQRGLLGRFRQVLDDGVVVVLAPALHRYLIRCAPQRRARHFDSMQQRVTIAPLRDGDQIVGTLVTIEDVTARRERERDLADDLASPDERTRLRAAQALADEPDSSPVLAESLGDPSWRVRKAVVGGLAGSASSAVLARLVRALRDDHQNPSVLNSALQVLAHAGADAVEPLIELLQSPDADLRGYVLLALGQQNDPRVPPALLRALDDPDANVRYHAIEALGNVGSAEATDKLLAIAESRDFFLAFPALDTLARIGLPYAAARIVPFLSDHLLQTPAAEALGRIGDLQTVTPLAEALNLPDRSAATLARALDMLYDRHESRYGQGAAVIELARAAILPAGTQSLLGALPSAQGAELPALARVLGWLDGPAIERSLARLLEHAELRGEVVEALVQHGPGVVDLLIEQLGAEDQEIRQAAVVALGRIGAPKAVPALLELLGDSELLIVAASALAQIGDPRAFQPLLGLLGHRSAVARQAAIGALNSLGHPELAARAGALLRDPNPYVRESAVKITGYFGYSAYADLLLECCRDPDERVRRAAIEHVAFADHPGVIAALAHALSDETAAIRAAAARAFVYAEDAQAVPLLLRALADPDPWVRYYAARSIGRHRAAGSVDALGRLAQADAAEQVRLAALEALGQIGGQQAAGVLGPFVEDGNPDIARVALAALGRAGHPSALAPLLSALGSPDLTRRLAAVAALGELRGANAAGPLRDLALAAADPQLALAALAALARLATPEAVAALAELTAQPARWEAGVAALAQLGAEKIELVARGLSHAQVLVRRAAVEALARMRHQRAAEYVGAALDDPDPSVRLAAATALGRLGSQSAARQLELLARSDPDAAVRAAAGAALQR